LKEEENQTLILETKGPWRKVIQKFKPAVVDFDSSGSESDPDVDTEYTYDVSHHIHEYLHRHSSFM
jgi:hypothetical protein